MRRIDHGKIAVFLTMDAPALRCGALFEMVTELLHQQLQIRICGGGNQQYVVVIHS